MTDLPRYRSAAGATWRERRGLRDMWAALSQLQQLQHQEHGQCRLLTRAVAAATAAVARWQANRETVLVAARTDLLAQVDAELLRCQLAQQDAERQLTRQRELLATVDAKLAELQQRFLAISERWPPLPTPEPDNARIWQALQRYEQQFVAAERRLPVDASHARAGVLAPATVAGALKQTDADSERR